MKKNQRGSALLWAIVVIMVLMITVSAALGISYSYYNRSIQNNERRQSYITAKGLIQDIVEKIELDNRAYINLIPKEENEVTHLNIELNENDGLGIVKNATITRVEIPTDKKDDVRGKITITVTVDYAGQEDTVNADMQLGRTGELKKWQLLKYYKGQGAEVQENINIKNAKIMLSYITPVFEVGKLDKVTLKNFFLNSDIRDKMLEKFPISETSKDVWGGYNGEYYSNDKFRDYLYYGYYDENIPKFENDAAKNFPKDLKDETFYIKSFCSIARQTKIIYAGTGTTMKNGDWNMYLAFNEEDGHWYDVRKEHPYNHALQSVNVNTAFDAKDDPDSEIQKYKEFKETYFIPERRID